MATLETRAKNAQHRAQIAAEKVRAAQSDALLKRLERAGQARGPRFSASAGTHDRTKSNRLRARGPGRFAPGMAVDAFLTQNRLERMRADGHDAVTNAPMARVIVERAIDMVVGRGFALQVETSDEEFNTKAEALWKAWASPFGDEGLEDDAGDPGERFDIRGAMSLAEGCRMAIRQVLVDGDVGVFPTEFGGVQFIDAARIVGPRRDTFSGVVGGPKIINGVEVDGFGAPVAYHVAEYNAFGVGVTEPKLRFEARRPGRPDGMILLARPDWNSQTRGEPRVAGVVEDLLRLDEFITDTAEAAHLAALAAFYTKTSNPDLAKYLMAQATPQDTTRTDVETTPTQTVVETGQVIHLGVGEDMGMLKSEQPGPQFQPFVYALARMIGSYLDLPLELVLMDFSQTNFHSGKSALIVAERCFEAWHEWLVSRLLKPLYLWRVGMWIEQEKLPRVDGWQRCTFTPPPRLVLDPENKAKTDQALIAGCQKTLKDCASEYGRDWRDILEQRSLEIKEMARLGIPLTSAPGAAPVNAPGGAGDDGGEQADPKGEAATDANDAPQTGKPERAAA